MKIKLLALDLDDTLLREDLSIAEEDVRTLRAAEDLGVHIVLASGRTPEGMTRYLNLLGMDKKEGYLISYNGGQILRSDTLDVEWSRSLDPMLSREIYQDCLNWNIPIQCYREGTILTSRENYFSEMDTKLTGMPRKEVSPEEFFLQEPIKMVIPLEPEALKKIADKLNEKYGSRANMFISKPYYFEILSPEADKGLALKHLAAQHGVTRDEVMAMGDAMNDVGMLRWAGISVAPANAREEILAMVNWVTTRTHNEGAVTEAIHRYIL